MPRHFQSQLARGWLLNTPYSLRLSDRKTYISGEPWIGNTPRLPGLFGHMLNDRFTVQ